MGKRSYVPFDVFAMRVDVPVSTAVRDGNLGWTCGQCPLTDRGVVHAPGNLLAQADFVCNMIENVMARADFTPSSIGRLHVYFTAHSEREAADALALIAARFDHGPLIVPVPVPHFYYAGMMIEVDVFAAADLQVRAPFEAGGVRLDLVDAGDQVWAHASVSSVDGALPVDSVSLIDDALARHGLHRDHLLGDLWIYAGDDDGARAIISCAQQRHLMTNPDALVRLAGPSLPVVRAALTYGKQAVAVVAETLVVDGLRLTMKKSGGMVWCSATCADMTLGLVGQTSVIMQAIDVALRAAGASFADVVKLTAHYTGTASEEDLHGNMKVRHDYYARPGPASTGLPVWGLGNERCRIAVDIIAV